MGKPLKRRKNEDKISTSSGKFVSIEVFNRLKEASEKERCNFLPKINRNDLIKAKDYLWVFLHLFLTDDMMNYPKETMPKLNFLQQIFLTFYIFDNYMRSGNSCGNVEKNGLIRLINDGYGEYVFEKTFSKIINIWGAKKISKVIKSARGLYKKHKDKIRNIEILKELSSLSSEIINFEKLADKYMTASNEIEIIKIYIENNIDDFAIIDEYNTQVSCVDNSIKEIETTKKIFEQSKIIDKYIEDNKNKLTTAIENNTLVISASDIFGENNTLINGVNTEINGKRVTIEIQKRT